MTKEAARLAAFERRAGVHGTGRDGQAQDRLLDWLAPHRGKVVSGYMPIRTEIDPRPVMAEMAQSGPVALPVIAARASPLRFARWTPDTPMVRGPFGAKVPEVPEWITPDVLIVPLLAFDARLNRLGYGGGYYDRTLAALRAVRPTLAVGFAFEAQFAEVLPLEPTDEPLDAIVTESRVLTA